MTSSKQDGIVLMRADLGHVFSKGSEMFQSNVRTGIWSGGRIHPSSDMSSFNLLIILKLKLYGFVLIEIILYQKHSFLNFQFFLL